MNNLIWDKEIEVCRLCQKKCDEITELNPLRYLFSFFRAGRFWNYYMSLWGRTINNLEKLQNEKY